MPPESADPAPLVQRLIALVARRGPGESTRLMHESGLTLPQILTLFALRRGPASITELSARLRLSLPATSQLVERLVGAGLVTRAEHEGDRRVRRVTLRSPGLRFLERFGELRLRDIEEALRSLSPATRASLSAALTSAVAELDREPDEVLGPPPVARQIRRRP